MSYIIIYNYIPLLWVSIHCQSKMENKIYKQGKVDDRSPILQPVRFRDKKQNENRT